MKKRATIFLISALALVLAVGGATGAWFTSETDPVTNTFTAGDVKITLYDEFDENMSGNVQPGDSFDKNVYVTSQGSIDTYVRVKLTPEWTSETSQQGVVLDTNVVKLHLDTTDWVKIGDWYYYKTALTTNGTTTNLLNKVEFLGEKMDDDYKNATFTIEVEAEAIQATNGAAESQWKVNTQNWTAIESE